MLSFLKKFTVSLVFTLTAAPLLASAAPTTTTLTVSPSNSVSVGTIVTLTASVSNPASVTTGTVNFCNTALPVCLPGDGLYGSAQLTSAGTAVIHTRFGFGVNNIKAVFVPTTTNAGSSSSVDSVSVSASQLYSSVTSVASTGSAGNYTLTGNVLGFGNEPLTGTISLLDTTNSNAQIGSTLLNPSVATFAAQTTLSDGLPDGMAVGDFNGDGLPDIVTTTTASFAGAGVAVFLGNGDGTFQNHTLIAVGASPVGLAVGDVNGDGKLDLIVTRTAGVSVLLGNGDGTFQSQVLYGTGVTPNAVAVADVNGDGKLDLVVGNFNANNVSVLLGNGDGTFQSQVTYTAASTPSSLAVADVNGDGKPDLLVLTQGNGVFVLLGNGDGTFQTAVMYNATTDSLSLAVGDFNGDGKIDLAVTNVVGNSVGVYLGNGDGTFQSAVTYATGSGTQPDAVTVGDFDGDGKIDLVAINSQTHSAVVLLGNGNGTFQPQVTYQTGTSPVSIAVADFNGDGMPDVAVGNGSDSVSVLLGEQTASYSLTGISIVGSGTHNVLASYAGDGSRTASQSSTVALTATLATSTVSVVASPNPTGFGSSVTFTATVTAGATGTVTFEDGGTSIGTGTISGTTASFSTSTLAVGAHTITAVYGGDTNFSGATSPAITQTISPVTATETQLSSTANPLMFGSPTTLIALVTTGANAPAGTVSFTSNGQLLGTTNVSPVTATNLLPYSQQIGGTNWIGYCGPLSNTTLNTSSVTAPDGTNTATAFVIPSNPFCGGSGALGAIGSLPGGLITGTNYTISVWLRGSHGGESVNIGMTDSTSTAVVLTTHWQRFTYTVLSYTPTGEENRGLQFACNDANAVYYAWGAQVEVSTSEGPYIATTASSASGYGGRATITVSSLAVGSDSLLATYSGDSNNSSSLSDALIETVTQANSSVLLSASPDPSTFGSSVVFTANVPSGATGTVTFKDFGVTIGTGTVSGATASLSISTLTGGTHMITGVYSGDSNFLGSTSLNLFQTVNQASANINLTSSLNPSSFGSTVTLTATVAAGATGTVTFKDGATNLGTMPISSGAASVTISTLVVGSHNISATYSGDGNFQ